MLVQIDGEAHGSYPEGEIWTDLSDPPEFRRILNLRTEQHLAGGTWVQVTGRTAFVS